MVTHNAITNIYNSYFVCRSWKSTTIFDFFKRKVSNSLEFNVVLPTTNVAIPNLENIDSSIQENVHPPRPENVDIPILENADIPIPENNHCPQTKFQKVDLDFLDYDPESCKQIWEHHVNQHDDIWWAYIKNGPHQPCLDTYKKSIEHNRSFQASWFEYHST